MGRKSVLAIALAATLLLAAFVCWPRRADLRAFDPAGMAQLETAMWRDYYEKRYGALFYHLYELSRTQFGFSPADSLRIALSAARAAKAFQPTRSRGGSQGHAGAHRVLRLAAAGRAQCVRRRDGGAP